MIRQHRLQDCSIYNAELHAIYVALQLVSEKSWEKVVICTDSRSAVNSLQTKYPGSHLLNDIFNTFQILSNNGIDIHFWWIPGHTGIFGNVQADRYAKDAMVLPHITHLPTDYNYIKSSLRQAICKKWQKQWSEETRNTQLKRIKDKIEQWHTANRLNRCEEKALTRMRIGHTIYTHSHIYTCGNRPFCNPCQKVQTIEHIIIDCRKFQNERRMLKDFCNREHIQFELREILGDKNESLLQVLFQFLRNIKLFDKL